MSLTLPTPEKGRQAQPAPAAVPFVTGLASYGDRPALVTGAGTLTYAELAGRVEDFAARLGSARRLVMVAGGNDVDAIVAYLAALAGRHPVLLVSGDGAAHDTLAAAYDPDVLVIEGEIVERRTVTAHDLHPDLALLLSTSGSTGSPKLVRLSADGLQANAAAIAGYLAIREEDLAVTTLPMHYCYGLSVINSHLLSGAGLLLTSLSVVDRCFWDLFETHGATTFAGVPYTFDLLDRVDFAAMELPSLRYVTQAGGRMAPAQVERYARLGQRRGFDLFVMYGQTEATARMAYLPPDLALEHPGAIGMPVPGGSLRLDPVEGAPAGTGELVYRGDNVMLGYAESPADLALGRVVTELRTGDLARCNEAGLLEIVGRRSRFAKVLGLRIDLERAEQALAAAGLTAYCADGGDALVVALVGDDPDAVRRVARRDLGLPPGALRIRTVEEPPRLASGKPDYAAIAALGAPRADGPRGAATASLEGLYAEILGLPEVGPADSFVSLGGDSLSYVEMSIRLEEALGHLPDEWHLTPVGDLRGVEGPARAGRTVETNVLLRALAIVAIVGTHGNLFVLTGGAHLLLGLAGFNFGRFHLTGAPRAERVRRVLASAARVAVPSALWIGTVTLLTSAYPWPTAALLNGVVGPRSWAEPAWHYWFVEALVYTLLALAALLAVPAVHRIERRWPFWLPIAVSAMALLTRYDAVVLRGGDEIHRAHVLLWLFALGWAGAKATTSRHRALVSALIVATVPGFFGDPAREAVLVAGLLVLLWRPSLRVPALAARAAGMLASASLYIYLTHWQVYPHLEDRYPLAALLVSLAVGIAAWRAVAGAGDAMRVLRARAGGRAPISGRLPAAR